MLPQFVFKNVHNPIGMIVEIVNPAYDNIGGIPDSDMVILQQKIVPPEEDVRRLGFTKRR